MAKNERRAKDAATAAMMKAHPGRYPDSAVRPWAGNGVEYRRMQVGVPARSDPRNDWGLLGGVLCARLGMGSYGIPAELLGADVPSPRKSRGAVATPSTGR